MAISKTLPSRPILNTNLLYLVWTEYMHRDGIDFPVVYSRFGQPITESNDIPVVMINEAELRDSRTWLVYNANSASIVWFVSELLIVKERLGTLAEITASTRELESILGEEALRNREIMTGEPFPNEVNPTTIIQIVEACISDYSVEMSQELNAGLELLNKCSPDNQETRRQR